MKRPNDYFVKLYFLLCLALAIASVTSAAEGSPRADKASDEASAFPKCDPAKLSVDVAALEKLKAKAQAEGSDAVVVVKDGRLIADWDFGKKRGPIEAMSATKSIVSLAVGRLIDEGKIESLDQPVSDFFLEWKQGRKRIITVRHLLNHTSGLEDKPTTREIYDSPDYIQFALAAELVSDPGARFFYSNKATNLLAGVVLRASGKPLDEYVKREIFAPLDITDFAWTKDRSGNPSAMAGVQITAVDFAKIGQLMLDEGVWRGRRVLSREWVLQSIRWGQPYDRTCGLLWWLSPETSKMTLDDDSIKELKTKPGLSEESVKKLQAVKGNPSDYREFWSRLFRIFAADANTKARLNEINEQFKKKAPTTKVVGEGPTVAFSARGYLGQYLVVVPKHRIVAVRQRRSPQNHDPYDPTGEFSEFETMVRALVK